MVLKRRLASDEIEVESMDIDTEDGRNLAIKHNIKAVPTLLVIDEDETFYAVRGSDDIIEELKKKNV